MGEASSQPALAPERDVEFAAVLLQLLRAEAPAEAFERLVVNASRVGDARQARALQSAVRLALEVRELLAARAGRERELAALYETAGDLSSLRELEPVLQAIVGRAHALLGCDAAYLMLNDDDRGRTYMRVTEGIRTEGFKNVELAMGAGLGGLVAATGNAYSTADYVSDSRFVHTLDPVVAEEALVAILGVPLKLAGRVIGVLFAANRRPRPFDGAEIALLGSLADHAAIAIENASLFHDLRRAFDDLREANGVIQAHSEAVERAATLHERLTGLVLGGRGLADVARSVVEVLGTGLLLLDPDGRLLASAGEPLPDVAASVVAAGGLAADPAHDPLRAAVAAARRPGRTRRLDLPAGPACTVAPVAAGTELLGALVAVGRRLDDTEVRSLERAALVTALLLLNERSVTDAEQRVRGELFDDLLNHPERDEPALRRRAARLGIALDRPHVVAVVRPVEDERRSAVAAAARDFAATEGGMSGEHAGCVVLLLPAGPDVGAGEAAGRLSKRLRHTASTPVTVGAAGPAAGALDLADAHRDAARCLSVLVALGRVGDAAAPDDLGVYGLLFSQAGQADLDRFVQRTLGPVLDYDRRRGSDLLRTLITYFESDGNLSRTAGELFVHVNTLYQRLDRVTQLLGQGWRHGDQALQVHLALKVRAALHAGSVLGPS